MSRVQEFKCENPHQIQSRDPLPPGKERMFAMHFSRPTAFIPMTESAGGLQHPGQTAGYVYQAVTIAAILLVLGSVWIF